MSAAMFEARLATFHLARCLLYGKLRCGREGYEHECPCSRSVKTVVRSYQNGDDSNDGVLFTGRDRGVVGDVYSALSQDGESYEGQSDNEQHFKDVVGREHGKLGSDSRTR